MKKKLISAVGTMMLIGSTVFASSSFAQAPPPPGGPDFTKASEALGVTVNELLTAIGGPPPDFVGGAEKLGVPVEDLIALLPPPPASDIPEGYTAEDFLQSE